LNKIPSIRPRQYITVITMTSDQPVSVQPDAGPGWPAPALALQAIAQVLRPLARLMIGHGLQLMPMVELLKEALVDEAQRSYSLDDKASSDTRVALLTGVHRKDVKRLREAAAMAQIPTAPVMPVAAAVVARWLSEARYLNADQTPRALARTVKRSNVGEPDFTTLVAEVSRDCGARAVLDELVRLGVVVVREDGCAELKSASYVPQDGLSESFHFLADNISDHLACAVQNLSTAPQTPRLLEQSAFCHELSADQAAQLQARARQLWVTVLQQFLQTATVAKQRGQAEPGPRHRVRFGVYFYDQAQAKPARDAPISEAKRRMKKAKT